MKNNLRNKKLFNIYSFLSIKNFNILKSTKFNFSSSNMFQTDMNYQHSIRQKDKSQIYIDNKNNELADQLEKFNRQFNSSEKVVFMTNKYLEYAEKNPDDIYTLYHIIGTCLVSPHNNRFSHFFFQNLNRWLKHKDSFFIYSSLCSYIAKFNESRHNLNSETIKNIENVLYEKGTLLTLRELYNVSTIYITNNDLFSPNFATYLERCTMHSIDNTLYKNQGQYKRGLNRFLDIYSSHCSVNFFHKIMSNIYQQIKEKTIETSDFYDILYIIAKKNITFKRMIKNNQDLVKYNYSEKLIIIDDFMHEIANEVKERFNKEPQLTSYIFEKIIPIALEFTDHFNDKLQDSLFEQDIFNRANKEHITLSLYQLTKILKLTALIFIRVNRSRGLLKLIEVQLMNQLKFLKLKLNSLTLSSRGIKKIISQKNYLIILKFVEINLIDNILQGSNTNNHVMYNDMLRVIERVNQFENNSVFLLLLIKKTFKAMDDNNGKKQIKPVEKVIVDEEDESDLDKDNKL